MLIEESIGTYCAECDEYHNDDECPHCGCIDTFEDYEYTCDICGSSFSDTWLVCSECGATSDQDAHE